MADDSAYHRKMKKLPSLALAALLLSGASLRAQSPASSVQGEVGGSLANVSRGSFRSVLRPVQDLRLSTRAAGIVEKFFVEEGQNVKAGDAILALDSDQEKAEVQQAEALTRGARVELSRASAEFKRIQSLIEDKIYSEKQYIEASTQAELARSRVDQSDAALALSKARLANRTLTSPINGIFLKTNKSVGESVERFETIARVVDVSSLEMVVYCDSQYLTLFKLNDSVKIRVLKNSEDQPIVAGKVVHIDPIVDPSSGTFRVKLQLPRSADASPGYSAILIPPVLQSPQLSLLGP